MSGLAIVDFREDWHVHSRFSDGAGTLEENISAAERAGLRKLGCVDHVRSSSTWMPEMAQALDALRPSTDVVLSAGVETKLLDVAGALDLPAPELLEGIDRIVIADHQVPSPEGPRDPKEVREAIAGGDLDPAVAAGWIIDSTSRGWTFVCNGVV